MTSKQRSNLRALANGLQPSVTVGKGGIGENVIREINDALEANELIKVSFLESAGSSARDAGGDLAVRARAELVQVMGNRVTLYRRSHKKDIKHIEY